jgi:hypothetical protein
MFYWGIGPTPPTIPTEYNLSTGCASVVLIPASDIEVGDITLCGNDYSIDDTFATQADFLTFLNGVFTSSLGLTGTFTIEDNELLYTTDDDCEGVYCIQIVDSITTETLIPITTEEGFTLFTES